MSRTRFWGTRKNHDELTETETRLKSICDSSKSYQKWVEALEEWRKEIGPKENSLDFRNRCQMKAHRNGWLSDSISYTNWYNEMSPEKQQQFRKDWEDLNRFPRESDLLKEYPEGGSLKSLQVAAHSYCNPPLPNRNNLIKEKQRLEKTEKTQKSGENTQGLEGLLKRLQKGPATIPEIAKEFGETSEEEAVHAVDRLYRMGYQIVHDRETKKVYLSPDLTQLEALHIDPAKNGHKEILRHKRKIGVVHGTFLGSKYSNPTLLHTVYAKFAEEEVDFVIHLGDVTAGKPPSKREGELFEPANPQKQVTYALAHYPRAKTFKTYFISGTRDLTFKSKRGAVINVVRLICSDPSRPDLIYRGDLSATFYMKQVRIEAINPGEDFAPYAKSYPLQNILMNIISEEESLSIKAQDDAVTALVGGSHVYDRVKYGNIHGVLVPSLQSLTPYQKGKRKRGFAPVVGTCIVELDFDEEWRLKRNKGREGIKIRLIKLKKYQKKEDYKASVKIKPELSELSQKILLFLEEGPRTEGEISRAFKINKTKVWPVIEELQQQGYQILTPRDPEQADTKQFVLKLKLATSFQPLALEKIFVEKKRAAFVSDTHYGSLDQLCSLVEHFYEICDEEKVDEIFHCGDWTAGDFDHPANRHKVFIPGTEGQIQFLTDWWPKSKIGIRTTGIGGNHDDQHGSRKGMDVLKKLFAANRPDIRYLGSTVGMAKLGKINIELLHPAGGPGYALSYKGQNLIESEIRLNRSRGIQEKIHVLALGNWHIYNEQVHSESLVICVPCFQQQTKDYMKPKGLDPWIGGLICDFVTDEEGYITEFATEFIDMMHLVKQPDFPEMPLKDFFTRYVTLETTASTPLI